MAPPVPERTADDDALDPGDLAPMVFCARCGAPDCVGCRASDDAEETVSPWEQRRLKYWQRLWFTARETTLSGDTFFARLTPGDVAPALAFAVTSELLAIGSFGVACAVGVHLMFPFVFSELTLGVPFGGGVAAGIAGAILGLSALMVALHILWGLSLEIGMRLQGAAPRGALSLRYALYACGWDLLTSPFGFAMACTAGGFGSGVAAVVAAVRVPRIATHAYLSTASELGTRGARRALVTATLLTGGVVLIGALGVALVAVVTLA